MQDDTTLTTLLITVETMVLTAERSGVIPKVQMIQIEEKSLKFKLSRGTVLESSVRRILGRLIYRIILFLTLPTHYRPVPTR